MTDMIERVARAIAEAGNGGVWTDEQWYKEYQRDVHRVRARAAIAAMSEPTEDMIRVGESTVFELQNDVMARTLAKDVYQTMTESALAA